jgi:hypothetical protein
MLTADQIAWVKTTFGIDINDVAPDALGNPLAGDSGLADAPKTNGSQSSPADATGNGDASVVHDSDGTEPGEAPTAAGATGSGEKVGIAPVIPVVVVGLKTLLGELTASVTITNNTKFTLTLDTSSLKLTSGEFKSGRPKAVLKPDGDSTNFVAHSTPVLDVPILSGFSADHAEGTIRYFIGDNKTVWSCHFNNPRILTDPFGTNSADAKIAGPNAAGIQQPPLADRTHGSDGTFTFSLDGSGGPSPPVQPGGGGDVAASCRVTVVNQTQQTVFLRKQDNAAGGDFVTNPATSLAPGASTQFVYAETPNSNNHNCRGTMSWDIGDPKLGSWAFMWDNQKGAKNLSASFLTPDDGTFHTLDQIDQGDENVPVTFTLSGGGAGPKPNAKPTSCAITVTNATSSILTLKSSKADTGGFQTQPPATIAPGSSAAVAFAGPPDDPGKGAKGSMLWDVGDPKAATWTNSWNNPPGDKNTTDATVDPATAGFKSDATSADGDTNVAMSFTISGGNLPLPASDDTFAPPPKSKQPTLRKGDQSPDGWVEYAQRLLNKWHVGRGEPKDTVNGKFDAGMEKTVKAFQADQRGKVDGVIGNETWSLLREGPHEAIGTDGRKPHSFEQKNAQGRFVTEKPDVTGYKASEDAFFIWVVSTGEQPIDDFFATVKVTQPDQTSHTHKIKIGVAVSPSPDNQGNFHLVNIPQFNQVFGLKQGVDPLGCSVDAYLDDAIGGDRWTGPVTSAG